MAGVTGICAMTRLVHVVVMVRSRVEMDNLLQWLSCCKRGGFYDMESKKLAEVVLLHVVSVLLGFSGLVYVANLSAVGNLDLSNLTRETAGTQIEIACAQGYVPFVLLYAWLLLREKCLRDGSNGMIRRSRTIIVANVILFVQWCFLMANYAGAASCDMLHVSKNIQHRFVVGNLIFALLEVPMNVLVIYGFVGHFKGIRSAATTDVVNRSIFGATLYLVSWVICWAWWLSLTWMSNRQLLIFYSPTGRVLGSLNVMCAPLSVCISHRDDLTIRRLFSFLCARRDGGIARVESPGNARNTLRKQRSFSDAVNQNFDEEHKGGSADTTGKGIDLTGTAQHNPIVPSSGGDEGMNQGMA